jgi:hypothetical protein
MQAKGWGMNRLFMSPRGAEFAREEQVEAMAGAICAGEQAGSPRRKPQEPSAWSKHACAREGYPQPGQSYSDVILRLARGSGGGE